MCHKETCPPTFSPMAFANWVIDTSIIVKGATVICWDCDSVWLNSGLPVDSSYTDSWMLGGVLQGSSLIMMR